jgi:hypothetical protein
MLNSKSTGNIGVENALRFWTKENSRVFPALFPCISEKLSLPYGFALFETSYISQRIDNYAANGQRKKK